MKLVDGMIMQGLPTANFNNPFKDMRALYGKGGTVVRSRHPIDRVKEKILFSSDRAVSATERAKGSEVTVSVRNLENPRNAAQWTALQAYRAKGRLALEHGHITVEVPGVRAHKEWLNRRLKADDEAHKVAVGAYNVGSEAAITNVNLTQAQFAAEVDRLTKERDAAKERQHAAWENAPFHTEPSPGSGNSRRAKWFYGMQDNLDRGINSIVEGEEALRRGDFVGLEMAVLEFVDASSYDTHEMPADSKDAFTVMYAKGDDLPGAARVLAKGYGSLLTFSNNPDVVVSGALGIPSLDRFDCYWEDAMAQQTALAAGTLMLDRLLIPR